MIEPVTGPSMRAAYLAAAPTFAKTFIRRSPEELAAEFAHRRQIALCDFFGPSRCHNVSHPRQECMAMLAKRGLQPAAHRARVQPRPHDRAPWDRGGEAEGGAMSNRGFDEYGAYGENNGPLPPTNEAGKAGTKGRA